MKDRPACRRGIHRELDAMTLPYIPQPLRLLNSDGWILFATRTLRLFAYGFLSVVLMIYLAQVGMSEAQIGLLFTLTLMGDTLISLVITTRADRMGRRRMLILGAALMVFAGIIFALTRDFVVLLIAATIGVISPSGYEVGPFLSIEQSSLTQIVPDEQRTGIFAWYNLVGSFATALGALIGGVLVQVGQDAGLTAIGSYRVVVVGYTGERAHHGSRSVLNLRVASSTMTTHRIASAANGSHISANV
ncbi:MAG: MFS transporter, partial [Planctomycetaceae bacterium]